MNERNVYIDARKTYVRIRDYDVINSYGNRERGPDLVKIDYDRSLFREPVAIGETFSKNASLPESFTKNFQEKLSLGEDHNILEGIRTTIELSDSVVVKGFMSKSTRSTRYTRSFIEFVSVRDHFALPQGETHHKSFEESLNLGVFFSGGVT